MLPITVNFHIIGKSVNGQGLVGKQCETMLIGRKVHPLVTIEYFVSFLVVQIMIEGFELSGIVESHS